MTISGVKGGKGIVVGGTIIFVATPQPPHFESNEPARAGARADFLEIVSEGGRMEIVSENGNVQLRARSKGARTRKSRFELRMVT